MKIFDISWFYGIGFCIQAINGDEYPLEVGDGEYAMASLNGLLIDFMCLRIIIGVVSAPAE